MEYPMHFIRAGAAFSTDDADVPAPYLRKSFALNRLPKRAELLICGLGFYELFLNGKKITKGLLSPYISNPDDLLFYDRYDLTAELSAGKNALGVLLGNGFQNNPGGSTWDFDKARFRGAPQTALRLDLFFDDGTEEHIESDESFRTAPSPILYDDYRNGEIYDARNETPGWCDPNFDDSAWKAAETAPIPRGEAALADIVPIRAVRELRPVSVVPLDGGYLYDFGENASGVCRLRIAGKRGQTVSIWHAELVRNGKLDLESLSYHRERFQKDVYILKGEGTEEYTPSFTYHGFQYALVRGIEPEQATADLLTYVVFHTDLRERGGFTCSDETVNRLQEMVRRSTLTNFHHFPTDCPQREKNGWTADASLSAEHTLLNLEPETNYRAWLHNIRRAQNDAGALPGIVPTSGWGFHWGNGPAWDSVLIELPYMTYLYRHDSAIVTENAHAILRYLDYLTTKIRADGLIACGLGDWCQTGRRCDAYAAPLEFTDTVISMDLCEKSAYLFGELGMAEREDFARRLYQRLRRAAREKLFDFETMTARGDCQTTQAMAIFYSLLDESERKPAFDRLLAMIHANNDRMDVGVLGGRVLFHVLSAFGYADLALKMIVGPENPSYGEWVVRGRTTLKEDFFTEESGSLNHHFWGDISHWFLRSLSGICYNPRRNGRELDIKPVFPAGMQFAEGWHEAPEGVIRVRWERGEDGIALRVNVPAALSGSICLPNGYCFADGDREKPLLSGSYSVREA